MHNLKPYYWLMQNLQNSWSIWSIFCLYWITQSCLLTRNFWDWFGLSKYILWWDIERLISNVIFDLLPGRGKLIASCIKGPNSHDRETSCSEPCICSSFGFGITRSWKCLMHHIYYYFVGIIELLREITFLNVVFALLRLLVVDCVSNGHKKLKVVWWMFVSFHHQCSG